MATTHIIHCLSWISPVLGWGFELSCPRTHPRKFPEDPLGLEPRTPGLRVKHFTTVPRGTPPDFVDEKFIISFGTDTQVYDTSI